jgi:hypothetical protein
VTVGDSVTVVTTVENRGGQAGSYTVHLSADETRVANATVHLDPGEAETVELTFTPRAARGYRLSVDGADAGQVEVRPAPDLETNTTPTPEPTVEATATPTPEPTPAAASPAFEGDKVTDVPTTVPPTQPDASTPLAADESTPFGLPLAVVIAALLAVLVAAALVVRRRR